MVAPRVVCSVSCTALLLAGVDHRPALAEEPYDEPALHRLDAFDRDLADVEPAASDVDGSMWLALQGKAAVRPDAREYGAMVMLGIPLERPLLARRADPEPPDEEVAATDADAEAVAAAPDSKPLPVLVTPIDARAAVRAALVAARAPRAEERIDDLAGRAKSSALLPEVRLRVTRLIDEDQRLAPTEYDPERTTASGGSSLWLEGRLMWRLDRLVFASEEVALERLRIGHDKTREHVSMLVVQLLGRWQRARVIELDDAELPDKRRDAGLEAMEAELALDVLTDGWFSRWQGREDGGDASRAEE